ncbi:glycerol kinase GlpK [Gynuella sunshinyii]|uniref:Glycerol kinase n=1 Tax=Gynuella sunshinyii YC6258 TaxID=1445510 RepID=A0A0C5VK49_9GAMM|nr:glycerol kinase GlpK [Gynuella sunshinyii]AJQ95062.1 glycerol kinase [Gynuella sunshinyii YC6258]
MSEYILAIDQGTTSTRAILFTHAGQPAFISQQEFPQHFPHDGWVEHNPDDLWQTTVSVCHDVIAQAGISAEKITAVGITNQRETTLVWDKNTGKPVYNAIVWQDRRTADLCVRLRAEGLTDKVRQKTGLLVDPYFSGTKVHWILNEVEGVRQRAENGELLFGTVDSYLIWKLTDGKVHATDATNAARTMLFNIHTQQWDEELLDILGIPVAMLPEVKDCAADYGQTSAEFLGSPLPIAGVAGDQQAALFGQACFQPGMCKSTYGTGCFMIMNSGDTPLLSHNQLLTTVGYRLGGKVTYALEGSIFMAGATMQWLRDGIKLIEHAADSERLAAQCRVDQSVYLVPAFTGLGAPHWDPKARGAIVGMTRDTGIADIVAAGLQSVGYQTRDLLEAMKSDGVKTLTTLRVDGGMVINDWAMQFLADILQLPVERPQVTETTALGAAMLAALQLGLYDSLEQLQQHWQCEKTFNATLDDETVERLYSGWQKALSGIKQIS